MFLVLDYTIFTSASGLTIGIVITEGQICFCINFRGSLLEGKKH